MSNGTKKIFSVLKRFPEELKIRNGEGTATLLSTGVIEYSCVKCGVKWWMAENLGGRCPACGEEKPTSQWTHPRIAFIPQK